MQRARTNFTPAAYFASRSSAATMDDNKGDDTPGDGRNGVSSSGVGGSEGGSKSLRYAEGPCTRMNLVTAINSGLRTAMETDSTAVRTIYFSWQISFRLAHL